MKKLLILWFIPILFTGCYTQVALDKHEPSYDVYSYTEREGEENENYTDEESFADTIYENDDSEYHYHIYISPFFRKYYWSYYPSFSVVIGIGNPWYYYDPWYWDPWFCDPWYYPVVYYPIYWYPGNYWWYPHYYHNYWTYSGPRYKYRNNDGFRIRNSTGFRNSFVSRNSGNRTNDQLLRERLRVRERTLITSNERIKNERNLIRKTDNRDEILKRKSDLERVKIINNDNTERTKDLKRKDLRESELRNRNDKQKQIEVRKRVGEKEYKSDTKTNTEIRKKTETKKREVKKVPTQTRKNETRKINKPRNNSGNNSGTRYNPPKNYNPPRYSTPPRQNSNPPPRSNNGGNRSGGRSGSDRSRR